MRTLTDDVIGVLRDGALTVGDGTGADLAPPYVVVYPGTQLRTGTLGDGWSDVNKDFLLICEGASRQQVEWVADRAVEVATASDLVVVAATVVDVMRDDTTGGPSRWKAPVRLRVRAYR